MKKVITLLVVLLGLGGPAPLQAQTLDPTFQPTVLKNSLAGLGIGTAPQFVVAQPDGKLLVSGGFDFMNGTLAGKVQRLNPDGTVDAGFNPGGAGANGFVGAMVLLPTGKIMLGGGFTAYNGVPSFTVARLNANGTLDPSFAPTAAIATARRQVGAVAVQPDGKVLVGGGYNFDTGLGDGSLYRLNPDGTLDTSFNVGTGVTTSSVTGVFVRSIFVQADGKIVVGGTFSAFNGQPVGNVVFILWIGVAGLKPAV